MYSTAPFSSPRSTSASLTLAVRSTTAPLGEVHSFVTDAGHSSVGAVLVTTINWTYATKNGKLDQSMVHRNTYLWTLRNLIRFIRRTEDVAEDVIHIREYQEV